MTDWSLPEERQDIKDRIARRIKRATYRQLRILDAFCNGLGLKDPGPHQSERKSNLGEK